MRSPSRFYMNPRKLEAVALKLSGMTYKKIGIAMGVTTARAQQLVMAPTSVKADVRRKAKGHCADCKVYIPDWNEDGYGEVKGHVHHDHHTETPELYNHPSNLVYLCFSCHTKRHGGHKR